MRKKADRKAEAGRRAEAGFSLMELVVALGVTLVIMVIASRMLAQTMAVRARENQRSEAVSDVQRALQSMTREISNAGVGMTNNGLVDAHSDALSIRVRANLNAFCGPGGGGCNSNTDDPGEDVVYAVINNTTGGGGDNQRLITRQDIKAGNTVSPLANRIDALRFDYLKLDNTAVAPSAAQKVRITVTVTLPAVGSPTAPGYQPSSQVQLVSEAVLRNQLLAL